MTDAERRYLELGETRPVTRRDSFVDQTQSSCICGQCVRSTGKCVCGRTLDRYAGGYCIHCGRPHWCVRLELDRARFWTPE